MRGLATATASARIAALSVRRLEVNVEALKDAFHPEVYATDEASTWWPAACPSATPTSRSTQPRQARRPRPGRGHPPEEERRRDGNLNLGYGRKKLAAAEAFAAAGRAKAARSGRSSWDAEGECPRSAPPALRGLLPVGCRRHAVGCLFLRPGQRRW